MNKNDYYKAKEVDLQEFLESAVNEVLTEEWDWTNSRFLLDDERICIYLGWVNEYDPNSTDCIHDKNEPNWVLATKVAEINSFDWADFDYLNEPWYTTDEFNGDIYNTEVTISPNENYKSLASWLMKNYIKEVELLDSGELTLSD